MPEFRITVATPQGEHSWLALYADAREAEKDVRHNGMTVIAIVPSPHEPPVPPSPGMRHPEWFDKQALTGTEVRERDDPETCGSDTTPIAGLRDRLLGRHPDWRKSGSSKDG